MPGRVDRVGERFGRLVVVSRATGYARTHWLCRCDCGREATVSNSNLKGGNTSSCGCIHTETIRGDAVGKRFGKLTVIKYSGKSAYGKAKFARYLCACDCGGSIDTLGMSLRNGDTISCGCAYADAGDKRRLPRAIKAAKAKAFCTRRRFAKKLALKPFDVELFDLVEHEAYLLAAERAEATGVMHHVDHMVPLQSKIVCGFHNEYNLQVITAAENCSKHNRYWPDMPSGV